MSRSTINLGGAPFLGEQNAGLYEPAGSKSLGDACRRSCEHSRQVTGEEESVGILVCGTGLAMSITANKVPGVRAALLYNRSAAEYARRHNDANVLIFGGRTMTFEEVRENLEAFFSAQFEGGKYARRNKYIAEVEDRARKGQQ